MLVLHLIKDINCIFLKVLILSKEKEADTTFNSIGFYLVELRLKVFLHLCKADKISFKNLLNGFKTIFNHR